MDHDTTRMTRAQIQKIAEHADVEEMRAELVRTRLALRAAVKTALEEKERADTAEKRVAALEEVLLGNGR